MSEYDREAPIMRRPWPTRGCCDMGAKIAFFVVYKLKIYIETVEPIKHIR